MSTHAHSFAHWPFDDPVDTLTYCTEAVAQRRLPALAVTHDRDGDWQFLDGTSDEPGRPVLVCLGCVFEQDPSLAAIADLPHGWRAWRDEAGGAWERWEKEYDDEDEGQDEHDAHACNGEAAERKALADIEEFGLHIIHVREEGKLPPFSYSIGIGKSLGMPELIVIGLRHEVAHAAINECYRQMQAGAAIAPGARLKDLLGGGFECVTSEVPPERFRDYMGWARWLYGGDDFRAWQIVYPNTAGVFPWEPDAHEGFRTWQPLLAGPRGQPA